MVVDGIDDKFEMNSGAFSESPAATGGFLSCCCLCGKKLHGLDIFMYRGDEAFCSVECRCKQILSDERKEKCWSKAEKPHESPLSPYLAPLPFGAGVAAA
ncbi:uncharacterized protein LOC109842970 [Asparagus officinalis]|nr:uncharacterized protein LOC109842970 [Asparagus officinalis]